MKKPDKEELWKIDIIEQMKEVATPYMKLMSYYKCALMEIETKFKVTTQVFLRRIKQGLSLFRVFGKNLTDEDFHLHLILLRIILMI